MSALSTFSLWTIYDHPTDFPDQFVARRWVIGNGHFGATTDCLTADTLEEIRAKLPRGLIQIARQKQDDPVIVEVWL